MADLTEGTVIGERFHVLGVLGRGGSATVYLAMDGLRRERVALKVVHGHLVDDAATRRRLQREVMAATLVQHDAALVPFDLHELDGHLILTMPYHPGQTLADRVAVVGALDASAVRALGVRLAGALARAHVAGVLHRDVTANNVLLGSSSAEAVLTDFGLARVAPKARSRSTGLLGTAGYAAPEVYAGERTDPRSDLYGLGCVLYLAAAGRPAFDPAHPMKALQAQLDEGFTPLAELSPELPADLVTTIESLLRRDPGARPQGAADVVDALEGRVAAAVIEPAAPVTHVNRQYLPPGEWTVVVNERDDDKSRRDALRARVRTPEGLEAEMRRWAEAMGQMVRQMGSWTEAVLGPANRDHATPEQRLTAAVAGAAGLPATALTVDDAMLEKRFRLVDSTDRPTARGLVEAAKAAGFDARMVEADHEPSWLDSMVPYFWVPIAVGWSTFPFFSATFGEPQLWIGIMIALSVVLPVVATARQKRKPDLDDLRTAFVATLSGALQSEGLPAPRYAVSQGASVDSSVAAAIVTAEGEGRAQRLLGRAHTALSALEASIAEAPHLPEPAAMDLRGTAHELRRTAEALASDVQRLEDVLTDPGETDAELARVQTRLDRLQTLERAGEPVSSDELALLTAAVAEHRADQEAAEHVEAALTASTARLLEIASTASRVRRELVASDRPAQSADALVARLRQQTQAVDDARREAGLRAQASKQRT